MNKARGLSIIAITLLILQIFSVNFGMGTISKAANNDPDPKVEVKSKGVDDDSLTWEVAVSTLSDEEATAKTNITFSSGQSHKVIDHKEGITAEQTKDGYVIETPTDGTTHIVQLTTTVTDESQAKFKVSAETESEGNTYNDEAQVDGKSVDSASDESSEEMDTGKNEVADREVNESSAEESEGVEKKDSELKVFNNHVAGPLPNITPRALHLFDEGNLEIDKKATPTDNFLEWEVELSVSGKDIKQETYDIVLVFDRSNSMNDGNREVSSKAAARDFADKLLDGTNNNIRIGVVPFGSNTVENSQYGRVSLTTNAKTVKDGINNIRIRSNYSDGGTHISAGLNGGKEMLAGSQADHQIIVLFSDGAPTYSYRASGFDRPYSWIGGGYNYILKTFGRTEGNGLAGNRPNYSIGSGQNMVRVRDHIIPTISHAHQEIMGPGIGVYSIGFEVSGWSDADARYTLENSQNLGYYNADSDDVGEIFDEISSAIKHAASGSYVIDEIGDMFEIVDGSISTSHGKTTTYEPNSKQINWDIGSIMEADGDYTLTYKVTLDCDKEPLLGKKYPTNEFASLHYKDPNGTNLTKDFPVPKVKTETGQITKVGIRVNSDGNPIDTKGNEVSIEEAVQLYSELYGEDLAADTYSVPAEDTPEGYVLHEDYPNPTDLELTTAVCNVVPFGYVKTGQFTIEKVDSNDETIKLQGATFEVENSKGEVVETLTTGPNGTVTSSVLPEGTYTLVETQAPSGYEVTPGQDLEVTIDGDASEPVKIVVTNELSDGKVKIIKTDASDGKPLDQVEFNILDSEGDIVGTLTTNSTGEAISGDLPAGDYMFQEVAAPTGYKLSDDQDLSFTIIPGETVEVPVTNTRLDGTVTINKVDENGEPLAGAEFTLTGPNNFIKAKSSDESGTIVFENLEWATYTLKETKAPENYRLLTNEIEVEISGENLHVEKTIENTLKGWGIPNTGGIGSLGFLGGGFMLMAGAGWFVYRRRYM